MQRSSGKAVSHFAESIAGSALQVAHMGILISYADSFISSG